MKTLARSSILAAMLVFLPLLCAACNSRYERQARAELNEQIAALNTPADFVLFHQFDEASTISMDIQSWARSELFFGTNSSIETVLSDVEWALTNAGWVRYGMGPGDNPWKLDDRVFLNLLIRSNEEFSATGYKGFRQWDAQVEDAAPFSTIAIIVINTTVNHPEYSPP